MALKQTDYGDLRALDYLRVKWNTSGTRLKIHLYQNNYTPVEGSVQSDFTEATYNGYASQYAANWTSPATVGGKGSSSADPLIFSHTAGATSNTIYGYWAEPEDDPGAVWYAEKFASSVSIAVNGDTLVLYPNFTMNTE